MTYEKYLKNLETFKKRFKGIWTILVPKDNDKEIIGEIEDTFDQYYCAIIRRPTLMEFTLYQKHIEKTDFISATEVIFNNCMLVGDDIIKNNDDIFLGLVYNQKFTEDFIKSLGIRKTYIDRSTYEVWIRKDDNDQELDYDFCINNGDLFDHFKFRKLGRNDLRDSSVFESIISQQNMLYNLCIEGDKQSILSDEEVFYSIYTSTILNLMFENKVTYLKKN